MERVPPVYVVVEMVLAPDGSAIHTPDEAVKVAVVVLNRFLKAVVAT
jgi:hypothetical protein